MRWAMLPPVPSVEEVNVPRETILNCVVPAFSHRHDVSAVSNLDSVVQLRWTWLDLWTALSRSLGVSSATAHRCENLGAFTDLRMGLSTGTSHSFFSPGAVGPRIIKSLRRLGPATTTRNSN